MAEISKHEQLHAQFALLAAIALQFFVLRFNQNLSFGPQYLVIATEVSMAILLATSLNAQGPGRKRLQNILAGILLAFISFANIATLLVVLHSLIHGSGSGIHLLASAIAIFLTNIIVYSLWYWEIDSPGLTQNRWTQSDKDFQFTQQDLEKEYHGWKPEFIDYLYLSVTNAVNFAPADARPVTHAAKLLMASQALISVFTLALVIARSVNILG